MLSCCVFAGRRVAYRAHEEREGDGLLCARHGVRFGGLEVGEEDDGCWLLLGRRQSIGQVALGRYSATVTGSCLEAGETYGMAGALGRGR